MKSVFEYRDYKLYLRDYLEAKGRGEKSRIAEVLRCHLAYVSQVLNSAAHLSFEQADILSLHLAHSEDEQEYFLLLVSYSRAGSASLRKRYEEKIRKILQQRTVLENRLKEIKAIPAEDQAIYYSAWHYSAIHLLISIPKFQTKEKIAEHLGLPLSAVAKSLEFLISSGLAEHVGGRYRARQTALHLKNESPWIPRHHASWRLQSIQKLDHPRAADFHYTSVVSMAEEDLPEIRKIMIEAIEKIRGVVKKSPEKAAYCYLMDLFEV